MATPRKTRGEYRPIYEALFHGKDYKSLTPDAKLMLLTLKGLCGAVGLKVWPAIVETLSELTGMPTPRAKKAVADLTATSWIEYEDGLVWIVRGLEFEPQVSHGEKHQKWVQNELAGLPRSPIVARFRERYAHFFPDRVSRDLRYPIDIPCDTTTPTPTPTPSLSPSPASSQVDHDGVLLLTRAANKGIAERYGPQTVPIPYGHSGAIPCLESLQAAGVDLDFAAAVIFAYASSMTNDRAPRSLKYFAQHVIDRWNAEQARRDATAFRTESVTAAPEVDQMRTFAVRYAQEGDAEWQSYCDERSYPWRKVA